jgi:hypothetical protein
MAKIKMVRLIMAKPTMVKILNMSKMNLAEININ